MYSHSSGQHTFSCINEDAQFLRRSWIENKPATSDQFCRKVNAKLRYRNSGHESSLCMHEFITLLSTLWPFRWDGIGLDDDAGVTLHSHSLPWIPRKTPTSRTPNFCHQFRYSEYSTQCIRATYLRRTRTERVYASATRPKKDIKSIPFSHQTLVFFGCRVLKPLICRLILAMQ
jgi:hypothetical protein